MSIDLAGKVVAVTGASSGIGEATALACARAGAAVALAARRTERIEDLAARIERDGGRALAIATDVGTSLVVNSVPYFVVALMVVGRGSVLAAGHAGRARRETK